MGERVLPLLGAVSGCLAQTAPSLEGAQHQCVPGDRPDDAVRGREEDALECPHRSLGQRAEVAIDDQSARHQGLHGLHRLAVVAVPQR